MSLYVILGLEPTATRREIERAYKRLARRYHPDLNPGDAEAASVFDRVTDAYETLVDPTRRRRYDREGGAEAPASREPYAFSGFDFSMTRDAREASTFGELFEGWLGQGRSGGRETGPSPGADHQVEMDVSFDEAVRGVQRAVTFTRLVRCGECGAAGVLAVPGLPCAACDGTGATRLVRGHMVFTRACGQCDGDGRIHRRACPACLGDGVRVRSDAVDVRVPAGVADGARIRIADQGHAGRRGGPPGHLYVRVTVRPHAQFVRHGDDLHLAVPVALHEAALGARIQIPTLDGPVVVRIPPGTQAGQRIRLRGRGAPSTLGTRRGDLIVEVRLVMPSLIDERSKELFRELGRIHSEDVRRHLWTGADTQR